MGSEEAKSDQEHETAGGTDEKHDTHDQTITNELIGAGGKLGAEMLWSRGNLTMGIAGSGALLVANREYRQVEDDDARSQTSPLNNLSLFNITSDETILLPVFEGNAELALNFTAFSHPAFIALGYKGQSWIDAIREVQEGISTGNAAVAVDRTHNLTTHRPYFRAGVNLGGEAIR